MAARPDSPRSGAALGAAPVGATRPSALFAGVEPLEVFVELLAGIDTDTSSNEFYDRICEAICRLTTMRRAAIFLADAGRRRVRAVGSHGTSFEQLSALRPTLVNTPIAQRALLEDEVIVVSEQIEQAVPAEYARMLGITTLVCTPLSAAGRAYGVICADRGGGRFELSDGERHLLWTLGKTAALVATARNATRQQERARRLTERLDLAREIHERVLQRLFGVSLALSAEKALEPEERERCRVEMQEAVSDLRRALERPLAPLPPETGTTLEAELERLSSSTALPLTVDWQPGLMVPGDVEPLAQSVLAEALRNIAKHATASQVQVSVACDTDTFTLEVRNDGARSDVRGAGMGLRLATFEALQHGGVLEFGPAREDSWRVRLVVPLAERGPALVPATAPQGGRA
jgi:signal transduction histidine kinase